MDINNSTEKDQLKGVAVNRHSTKRSARAYAIYYVASQAVFDRGVFILFLLSKGFSNDEIGIMEFALFLGTFLSEIPTGIIGDKIGRKKSVITGLFVLLIYVFGVITFNGFIAFLILYAAYGVGISFISGSDRALIYDVLKSNGHERMFLKLESRTRAIGSLVLGLAIVAGGYLQILSWNYVYIAYAVALVISMVSFVFISDLSLSLDEDHEQPENSIMSETVQYFINGYGRTLLPLMMFSMLMAFAFVPFYIFSQASFQEQGLQPQTIAIIFAVAQLAMSIGHYNSYRLQKKFDVRKSFIFFALVMAMLLSLNAVNAITISVAAFFMCCVVDSCFEPIYTNYINTKFESRIRATANSVDSFTQAFMIGVGYILYGYLSEIYSFSTIFAWSALLPLIAIILCARYFRQKYALQSEMI